jgi:hypothetical protein
VEVFPEGDHDFFLKVIDAQITFETDSQGKATSLVLHQGGNIRPAGSNNQARSSILDESRAVTLYGRPSRVTPGRRTVRIRPSLIVISITSMSVFKPSKLK